MKRPLVLAVVVASVLVTAINLGLSATETTAFQVSPQTNSGFSIDALPANGAFTLLYPPDGAGSVLALALYVDALIVLLVYVLTRFRRRSPRARLTITLIVLPVIYLIADRSIVSFSTLQPCVYLPDPRLMWRVQPDLRVGPGAMFASNAHGLRGAEIEHQKPPDVFRIVVLGDSSLFGHGVGDDETFSVRLQKHLEGARPGRRIEVLNAAVPGYTTWQGLTWLRSVGVSFEPDWIIVGFNNDAAPAITTDRLSLDQPAWVQSIKDVLYQSAVYLVIRKTLISRSSRKLDPAAQDPNDRPTSVNSQRVPLGDFQDNLQSFQALARAHGAGLTIAVMPRNRPLQKRFSMGYREAMLAMAPQGVMVADFYAEWAKPEDTRFFIEGDRLHPNAAGQDRLARSVATLLQAAWKVNASSTPSSETP